MSDAPVTPQASTPVDPQEYVVNQGEISQEDIARVVAGPIAQAKFDVTSLNLGEIATVEDLADQGIGALAEASAKKGLLLAAIAFVVNKRSDPSYTFARAQALSLKAVQDMLGSNDDDADPKE